MAQKSSFPMGLFPKKIFCSLNKLFSYNIYFKMLISKNFRSKPMGLFPSKNGMTVSFIVTVFTRALLRGTFCILSASTFNVTMSSTNRQLAYHFS